MSETIIRQRPDEDIVKALDRAHAEAVGSDSKYCVLATTDSVKLRVFEDDNPEEAKARWMKELELAGLLFMVDPDDMGPKLEEAIALANEGPLGRAYVRETSYGVMVPVGAGETVQDAVERLNAEFGRLVELGEIDPKPEHIVPPASVVPIEDGDVGWEELHPIMREVVISGLREQMERASFVAAQSRAQQVAMAALVGSVGNTTGGELSGAMMDGLLAGMGSAQKADDAQRRAFRAAIRYLSAD